MDYILYLRVSTTRQGQSGLGLEAQRSIGHNFVRPPDRIISEYVEVESGRKAKRPQLALAIGEAKAQDATLLVANLSRLARNVAFISTLRDERVRFTACDMPGANELTVDLINVINEDAARTISKNTKAALKAKKQRGHQLGSPQNLTDAARAKGRAVMQQNAREATANRQAQRLSTLLRAGGQTLQQIAHELNEHGYRTRRGKPFRASTVLKLLQRLPVVPPQNKTGPESGPATTNTLAPGA